MRYFKDLSIKYKLFLVYGMLAVLIFSLSFSLFFTQVRTHLEGRIRAELNKSNQIITDMVETTASVAIKNHLRAIAEKNKEFVTHLYDKYQGNLISESQARERAGRALLHQTVGETGYIYCVDSNGVAAVHPREKVRGQKFDHLDFVREQMRRKEGYLEYDWKNPGETKLRPKALYMTYFEPWDWIISVSSYKSEFSKLVSVDDFRDSILDLTFGETGYSFILDLDGKMIVHPQLSGNVLSEADANGVSVAREMIRRKKGYLTYDWQNPSDKAPREKFIAFDCIPDFGWIIASSFYTSEVFAPLDRMRKLFWAVLLLSLGGMGGVTLFISTSLTKPLTAFIRTFEKGTLEGLASKLDENRKDEFGKFSASFNLFMDKLDTYRRELMAEIRARKETEKKLARLRSYLENIIDSMPSMLVGIDTRGRVSLWNRRAQDTSGIPIDKAMGRPLGELCPRISGRIKTLYDPAVPNDGIRQILKLETVLKGGDKRFEDVTVYPLTENGFEGAVIRIDDVTEKVRMEEILIQSEKMLSVGGLAAGMAHEINNPLAGVIQNAGVLANRLNNDDIPANIRAAEAAGITMASIRSYMEARRIPRMTRAIIDSGRRMASIVENMLSFARKGDNSFSTHDPAGLIDGVLELAATDYNLGKHYDFRAIHVRKMYAENLPMITCAGNKIRQVLLNILTNGAQAMTEKQAENKTYTPEFVLRLSAEEKSRMLRIEVADNGPGLDEAIRKRVFEPFFTTKPVGLGTGLGLSVSYFIVTENHGGTLDVGSEPGQGTTFVIRLPLNRHPEHPSGT